MNTKYVKKQGRDEVVLGEAATPAVEERADKALQTILNPKRVPGNIRPVRVVSITKFFHEKYASTVKSVPRVGQVFPSALEASLSIGGHFASVTTALSHAKRKGERSATVRGVKFTFA